MERFERITYDRQWPKNQIMISNGRIALSQSDLNMALLDSLCLDL